MRGRHDNHQRFEVPATNGCRPIAGGRLCGGKVSELFRTGEWICRRSNGGGGNPRSPSSVRLVAISTRSHRTVVRDETAASLQASSLRSLWRAFRPARKRNAAGLPVKSVDGAPQYD